MSDLKRAELDRNIAKLKKYYPEETDSSWFEEMAEAMSDHDEDVKLGLTDAMAEYFEADRDEKLAKARKESLKPIVLEQMKDLKHPIRDLTLGKQERLTYNESVFYTWVEDNYPTLIDKLTSKVIDKTVFGELLAKKEVRVPDKTCYVEATSDVLTCKHPKKRK